MEDYLGCVGWDSDEKKAKDGVPRSVLGEAAPTIAIIDEDTTYGAMSHDDEQVDLEEPHPAAADLREVEALYGLQLRKAKDRVSRWRAMQVKEAFPHRRTVDRAYRHALCKRGVSVSCK